MEFISTKVKLKRDYESNEYEISFRTRDTNIINEYEKLKNEQQ